MYKQLLLIKINDTTYKEEFEHIMFGYFEDITKTEWISNQLLFIELNFTSLEETLDIHGLEELLIEDFDTLMTMYLSPRYPQEYAPLYIESIQEFKQELFDYQVGLYFYEDLLIKKLVERKPLSPSFKDHITKYIDSDTTLMIHGLMNNNLKVTETAKSLFIHRNTLNYRLDKFYEHTGLNLKTFKGVMCAYLIIND